MDLNMSAVSKTVYTVFDLLSDVGGLLVISVSIMAIYLGAWNYNSLDNYIVSRLFRIKKPKEKIDSEAPSYKRASYIKLSCLPNCSDWFSSWMPLMKRCKRSR